LEFRVFEGDAEHVVGLTGPQFGQGLHDGTADFYRCRGSEE